MKFIFKTIALILIFFISLMIFLPKIELFNLVEKELEKRNIVISNEIKKEKLFGIDINNAEIYYDGINTAFIKSLDLKTYFLESRVKIKEITISNSLRNMFPAKIKDIKLKYSLLKFDRVDFKAFGDFGEFRGDILLFENKFEGELVPSDLMKSKYRNLLRQFKLVEGKYRYEFKF